MISVYYQNVNTESKCQKWRKPNTAFEKQGKKKPRILLYKIQRPNIKKRIKPSMWKWILNYKGKKKKPHQRIYRMLPLHLKTRCKWKWENQWKAQWEVRTQSQWFPVNNPPIPLPLNEQHLSITWILNVRSKRLRWNLCKTFLVFLVEEEENVCIKENEIGN